MHEIIGILGAILGLIAALRWVWVIAGFFFPPLWLLAIIGFLLYWASEPYAQPPKHDGVVRRIKMK